MKKLKTRDEFLNEGHAMGDELENARMMKGSASELVEWAQRKIAESRPENFKEGVINPVQEAKQTIILNYNTDPDDIEYVEGILKDAGILAKVEAGIDSEEVEITLNKGDLKKATRALSTNGLELQESVNEKKSKEVTKKMWDKEWALKGTKQGIEDNIAKRENALLSAFKDPDDAENWFDKKWDQLPPQATSNMTIYEGYGFVKISPKQDKLKLAIKKQEREARLKANRGKPLEFEQLALNRIMLTKVLGRGDLEKEYEDAYQRLLKKYDLKESVNEAIGTQLKPASNDTLKNGFTINDDNIEDATSPMHYIEALVLDYGKNPRSFQNTATNKQNSKFWTYNRLLHFYHDIQSGKKESYNTKKGPDGKYHLKKSERKDILKMNESVNEGKIISADKISMIGPKILGKIKIGTKIISVDNEYTVTGFGPKANAFQEFEVTDKSDEDKKVKLTAMYGVKLEVTDDPRSAVYRKEEKLDSIILESMIIESVNDPYIDMVTEGITNAFKKFKK